MEKNSISEVIKNRRIELDLSLEYVGRQVGVNRSTIFRWETGETSSIKRGHIYLLSKCLYLPIETLLGFEGENVEDPEIVKRRLKLIENVNKIKDIEGMEQVDKYISVFILK